MTKRMIAAQLSVGALLLVLVALMESYTGWDTAAQRLWFDSATHEWVVSNELHARGFSTMALKSCWWFSG